MIPYRTIEQYFTLSFRWDLIRWTHLCQSQFQATTNRSLRVVICTTWTVTGCSIHTVSGCWAANTYSHYKWTDFKGNLCFLFFLQVKLKRERKNSFFSATEIRPSWKDCVPSCNKCYLPFMLSPPATDCVKWSMIQFTYATDVFNNKKPLRKYWPITLGSFFSTQSIKKAMD